MRMSINKPRKQIRKSNLRPPTTGKTFPQHKAGTQEIFTLQAVNFLEKNSALLRLYNNLASLKISCKIRGVRERIPQLFIYPQPLKYEGKQCSKIYRKP